MQLDLERACSFALQTVSEARQTKLRVGDAEKLLEFIMKVNSINV